MKVIDLLNKIANGEEIPKKIYFWEREYIYDEEYSCYTHQVDGNKFIDLLDNNDDDLRCFLNDEVETIEEDKKIEELKVLPYEKCIHEVTHKEKEILLEIRDLQIAFNEIIGVINNVKHRRD